ncbi:uncharacterized protein [Solanum lycopersicum]|uniref:uncharacterized protein isoform X2 n=1 Tax=Solanum lycopersicum TaxID=4081 RepID=UPI000532BDFD
MSGGFFRGTSAEQDTRFSNKQAKLLKSQKFAPELEHLVDMTKVKMDVIKPWIAKRVTELIGFEDEVLINFIYSLLERKVANGKELQISLTGFMERNTAKFMKELWALLLSAQNNASGVPQQFLEAKEEEMRNNKAEMDRIANEIQKKKERDNRELNQEKRKKMDDYGSDLRQKNTSREPTPKQQLQVRLMDNLDPVERNGSSVRNRSREKYSSIRYASPVKTEAHKGSRSLERRRSSSGSPQKRIYDRKDSREKDLPLPPQLSRSPSVPESPHRSRSDSESPPTKRGRSPSEDRGPRSTSNPREIKTIDFDSLSPSKLREQKVSSDISEKIADQKEMNHSREAFEHKPRSSRKIPTTPNPYKDLGKRFVQKEFSDIHSHSDQLESRKRNEAIKSEKFSGTMQHSKELDKQKSPSTHRHSHSVKRLKESYDGESVKADKENLSHTNDTKGKELYVESEAPLTSSKKVEQNDLSSKEGSGFEESEKRRAKIKDKRKHKRSDRYESTSDDSFDSDVEDRKEAKKRRKEERRLKKEEKRRRREERRHRKEERRSQKRKSKSVNAISSPSDTERNPNNRASDDEHLREEYQHGCKIEESESLQKRLEIELREKALESLRAKKGVSH